MSDFGDDLAGLSVGGEIIADSSTDTDPRTGIKLEDDNPDVDANPGAGDLGGTINEIDIDKDADAITEADHRRQREDLADFAVIEGAGVDLFRGEADGQGQEGAEGEQVDDSDQGSLADEVLKDVMPPGRTSTAELSIHEINAMKSDLLFKLRSLEDAGYTTNRAYSSEDSLVSLQLELRRLQELEDLSYSLKLARGFLTHSCSLIETINETTKISPLKLRGFSAAVRRDVDARQYDSALTELSQKYFYTMRMSCEMKLLIGLGTSAVNCHLTNSLLEASSGQNSGGASKSGGAQGSGGFGFNANPKANPNASADANSDLDVPAAGGVGNGSGGGGRLQGNLFNLASTMMNSGSGQASGPGTRNRGGPQTVEIHQPQMSGPSLV